MNRLLLALGGALALTISLSGAALAQSAAPTETPASAAAGTPGVSPASTYGYYIWFDGGRVHLRTTDPGDGASVYTGTITTDGTIHDVDLIQPEPGHDWAIRSEHSLDFHFRTANQVDGVSFAAAGASRLTFRLYRNGHLIRTDHIFLGAGGANPPGNPFTLIF